MSFASKDDACDAVRALSEDQLATYRRQPRELISHANREDSAVKGYRGRQLLELLQNADDAGAGHGEHRLLIDLRENHLVVANDGVAFTMGGLESLVISDCSPKQLDRNRFIGCKGLGFRSVLTWTDAPLIVSGHLWVAFSRQRALQAIEELAGEDPRTSRILAQFADAEGHLPVPIMRFPHLPDAASPAFRLALTYQESGYSTVIVLPLKAQHVVEDVLLQLSNLPIESLLFCRHVTAVQLRGGEERDWVILREEISPERMRLIIRDTGEDRLWTIHRREGTLPAESVTEDGDRRREFQTAIAVPQYPRTAADRTLCVFFPTRDALPLPVVLHATLVLGDDRNRVHDTVANRAVLAGLAEHLVDVVAAEAEKTAPKRALRLLDGLQGADPELGRLGFVEAVLELARNRAIFPHIDGELGTARQTKRAPHDAWRAILQPKYFAEVLDIRPDEKLGTLLQLFGLEWFDQIEVVQRLRLQLADMSPFDAGRVVGRLISNDRFGRIPVGTLIVDATGALPPKNAHCFFAPSSRLPDLPEWASDVRFMHADFQSGLQNGAAGYSRRGLPDLLKKHDADVDEYGLDTVARALVRRVWRAPDEHRRARVRELLRWLMNIGRGSSQSLSHLNIPVLDRGGTVCSPADCYLGFEYSSGATLDRLYHGVPGAQFVASPGDLGLELFSIEETEELLRTVGVRSEPRMVALPDEPMNEFIQDVIAGLDYPRRVRGIECDSPAKVSSLCREWAIEGLLIPDGMPGLIENCDPTGMFVFLLGDGSSLLTRDLEEQAFFKAKLSGERVFRVDASIPIPNPVLHFLRKRSWIPADDDLRHAPSEIVLSTSASRILRGLFFHHRLNMADPAVRRVGGRPAINGLLTRLGATSALESIESEALYDLLLRLPEQDPDGEHAPGIYRTLIEATVPPEDGRSRRRFLKEGRVWSRYGGTSQYLPVSDARYNANIMIPALVEQHIPIAELPRRKSQRLVRELFGVKALNRTDIVLQLREEETEFDPTSEEANARFQAAIPYIYALRLAKRLDEDNRERNLLRRAELRLCRRIAINVQLATKPESAVSLSTRGDSILLGRQLMMVDEYYRDESLVRFWHGVANLVAEMLGTDVAAEVANVLRCNNASDMEDVVREQIGPEAQQTVAEALTRMSRPEEPESAETHAVLLPRVDPGGSSMELEGESADNVEPANEDAVDASLDSSGVATFVSITGPAGGARRRRRLVIASDVGATRLGSSVRGPLAREDLTFLVAEAFEDCASPKRFPLRVSHIHGLEGFGCDILSLHTDEARQRALRGMAVGDADIARFIEVKGRSSRTGQVELTENELKQAESKRARYFLYRVFRDPNIRDRYELAILQDPVNSRARRNVVRFDLVEGSGAEWFSMVADDKSG